MSDTFSKQPPKHAISSSVGFKGKDGLAPLGKRAGGEEEGEDPKEYLISDRNLEKQERELINNSFLIKFIQENDVEDQREETKKMTSKQPIKSILKNTLNNDLKAVEMAVTNNAK